MTVFTAAKNSSPRADLLQDLLPGNTFRSEVFEIVKASIKLLALRVGQRNALWLLVETVPEFLDQTQTFFRTQVAYVKRRLTHKPEYATFTVSLPPLTFLLMANAMPAEP
jgi:hypothetical protein